MAKRRNGKPKHLGHQAPYSRSAETQEDLLALLKKGPSPWNAWRKAHPDIPIDLSRVDLSDFDIDLKGVDFSRCTLRHINLSRTDLTGADFSRAQLALANLASANLTRGRLRDAQLASSFLRQTILVEADLTGASLRFAELSGANLTAAQLVDADLSRAAFVGVDFSRADFTRSRIHETVFGVCRFEQNVGLETAQHFGPSTLDHRTYQQSTLPLSFLRGCGLPDSIIDSFAGLKATQGPRYDSCFISYATADEAFASRLFNDLQKSGVRCWFAPHSMVTGEKLHEQISTGIDSHDRLLLILSAASMASPWVRTEIGRAREKEKVLGRHVLMPLALVPFRDIRAWRQFNADLGEDTAREIREYFLPDFSNPDLYGHSLEQILRALRRT